jgi:HYR domain-containing protein
MNARKGLIGIAAVAVALTIAPGVFGSPKRAAGTLQLKARFAVVYDGVECPSGTPAATECFRFVGNAVVPGLGRVTETYGKTRVSVDGKDCVRQMATAVIEVAGKGEIFVSTKEPELCGPPAPASTGPYDLTITGGSGRYTGASGSAEFRSNVNAYGTALDDWTGTLAVPGLEFDVVAPALRGAVSKTVRAPKGSKRVRVRYVVTAQDAVDGSAPVACVPRSGSIFGIGRTKVTCSATDSSGNLGGARFTVTVRRR